MNTIKLECETVTPKYEKRKGNIFVRDYINPNQKFSVIISLLDNLDEEIINVFQVLSTFSGLGSRSRNGFGLFRILSIGGSVRSNNCYNSQSDNYTSDLPKYSAFSQNIKLWKTKKIMV